MNETWTGINTPNQSEPGSNVNKGILHTLQKKSLIIRYSLVSYTQDTPFVR